MVRRNKNDAWIQLGIELEKDALGNQRRFWASVNRSKEARDRMQQICGSDGRVLVGVEIRDRWKEHFEGLYGAADRSGNHTLSREATMEGEPEIVKEGVRIRRGLTMLMGKVAGMCGSKEARARMQQICGSDGRVIYGRRCRNNGSMERTF